MLAECEGTCSHVCHSISVSFIPVVLFFIEVSAVQFSCLHVIASCSPSLYCLSLLYTCIYQSIMITRHIASWWNKLLSPIIKKVLEKGPWSCLLDFWQYGQHWSANSICNQPLPTHLPTGLITEHRTEEIGYMKSSPWHWNTSASLFPGKLEWTGSIMLNKRGKKLHFFRALNLH